MPTQSDVRFAQAAVDARFVLEGIPPGDGSGNRSLGAN